MQPLSHEHRKGICQILRFIDARSKDIKDKADDQKLLGMFHIIGMVDATGFLFPEFQGRLLQAQKSETTDFGVFKVTVVTFIEWIKENNILPE